MKHFHLLLLCLFCSPIFAQNNIPFEKYFENKTLRVDYYHTGTATIEHISLDKAYEQGVWAGSRKNLIDTLNLGKFFVKVFDVATNQLIYSRGFASIYGEWETTGEAVEEKFRSFHESVLLPFPQKSVQVVIAKRDKWMHFQDIFSTVIDPASRFVNRGKRDYGFKVSTLHESGSPHERVDFLILAEGYTKDEIPQFRKDSERWKNVILGTEPFKTSAKKINIRAIEAISQESGIDEPRRNIWKNTALGCSYSSFDSPRYVLTFENKTMRDIASAAPYDFIYILYNGKRYGGGGIYNLYATGMNGAESPDMDWHVEYMFTHEFGHSFASLGDEYYSSSTAYNDFYPPGVEPESPNVTALLDPENIKWKSFIEEGTPVPTPWPKTHTDSLEGIRRSWQKTKLVVNGRRTHAYYIEWDKLRASQLAKFQSSEYAGKIGVFEGAGYSSKGLYRPAIDCRMFSRSLVPFDPVCQAGIQRVIDFYSK